MLGQRLWAFWQSKFGSQVGFSESSVPGVTDLRPVSFGEGWSITMSNSSFWWVPSPLADPSLCQLGSSGFHPGLIILPPPAQSSFWTLEEGPSIHNELIMGRGNNVGRWDAGGRYKVYADAASLLQFTSCPWRAKWTAYRSDALPIHMREKDNECLLDEAIYL